MGRGEKEFFMVFLKNDKEFAVETDGAVLQNVIPNTETSVKSAKNIIKMSLPEKAVYIHG